ncbi:class I SAM-dependent methyltransferase [Ketogulonicigenium vulgare]|uniref:ATP synthase beta subunit/transription termination factor rho n=1 Tax=Ketogulonicigenium vulgare (strain WSH-001) TaxID=759362 RepID=F9YAE1_KETVW|nr:SAM-dependent methyltransferase [Ketogulonicigenium vulgare]ADO42104.1 conserved hypothetical protein [Ketogulonicigenium vulgare Y25]AEM40314.1 ATP synthase beta subunit/transription termination factor rho [Ketogulonicigenium vulgare WSH-001]ALJ82265.1 ATP synthase subunit beta [Ketogulonicigenium vulgare]ANW33334.1 methyltransferase [Ketogulonicigenium vulgare]AOZ54024.1 hypothetical protein KVC_1007 [Ketogulonicigenium vulgare]
MSLAARIKRMIAQGGPMRLSDYMSLCLLDPEAGYYTTRTAIGAGGDFITAPEVSQVFGELIGLALAQAWLDQGAPDPCILAELGPGRGTLMADILRATRKVPGFHAAAQVVLVEASPLMRTLQAANVPAARWCDSVEALPAGPLFLIANEFLDALPIRQFQRSSDGWHERLVTVQDGALTLGLGPQIALPDAPDADVFEQNTMAESVMRIIASRIAVAGGAAIFIDYGADESRGDTFQAVQNHAYADPFSDPGTADLTAHVAFGPLARAATNAGAAASALITQADFLLTLGLSARGAALARHLSGAALDAHQAALNRLTHPGEMGTLFKVLGITPAAAPAIAALPRPVHST